MAQVVSSKLQGRSGGEASRAIGGVVSSPGTDNKPLHLTIAAFHHRAALAGERRCSTGAATISGHE